MSFRRVVPLWAGYGVPPSVLLFQEKVQNGLLKGVAVGHLVGFRPAIASHDDGPVSRQGEGVGRLPLGEGQAAWTTRALMLLAPLLSFTLVEYLNYNNPWTDFTSLQTALNLAWYYLGRLFFYFVLRRRASAVKWAMGDRLGAWAWPTTT